MPSNLVSRRAVTRGAAWTVPLVAVAVAAPAFAVSASLTDGSLTVSCKCGAPTDVYRLSVSFNNLTGVTWTITGTTLTTNTAGVTITYVVQSYQLPSGAQVLVFEFHAAPHPGDLQINFTYTAKNNATGATSAPVLLSTTAKLKFAKCGTGTCP